MPQPAFVFPTPNSNVPGGGGGYGWGTATGATQIAFVSLKDDNGNNVNGTAAGALGVPQPMNWSVCFQNVTTGVWVTLTMKITAGGVDYQTSVRFQSAAY